MKYVGSKSKIKNEILPIILKDIKKGQTYIEPFVGGCNIIDGIDSSIRRCGSDFNPFLIAMWKGLQMNLEK
jgi:site-specific DNA-adenine methylase